LILPTISKTRQLFDTIVIFVVVRFVTAPCWFFCFEGLSQLCPTEATGTLASSQAADASHYATNNRD